MIKIIGLIFIATAIAVGAYYLYGMRAPEPAYPVDQGYGENAPAGTGTADVAADLEGIDVEGLDTELGEIEKEIAQ